MYYQKLKIAEKHEICFLGESVNFCKNEFKNFKCIPHT